MNKKEFLTALGRALPHKGKGLRSVLNFYGEMIDDLIEEGLSEAEAIERIGSVEEVAKGIETEGLCREVEHKRRSAIELVLLILGAPLWFSLLLTGFSVAFALYAVLWSLIVVLWTIELPFLLFSLISKALFPACKTASLGALSLTRRGAALSLALFKKGPSL